MTTLDTLQERLAALQETTGQLRELIDQLANIQFQPGFVPLGSSDEDNVAAELGAEISQILREEEEDLELLHEEIVDLRSGRPGSDAEHRKTRLKEGAQRLGAELKDCHTAFRKAQLSARRNLEAAQKLERELLLASYAASAASPSSSFSTSPSSTAPSNPANDVAPPNYPGNPPSSSPSSPNRPHSPQDDPNPRNQLFTARDRRRLREKHHHNHNHQHHQQQQYNQTQPGQPDVLGTSSDITLSLQRTHALIAGELAKSAFAAQTLAESTAALAELQRGYEGLGGALARSRDLVGALLTARRSDTWYLQAAVRLLLATLAWLVFRRFLYGPLWWLVWLPLRTGWRAGQAVSSAARSTTTTTTTTTTAAAAAAAGAAGGAGGASMAVVLPGADGEARVAMVGVGEEGAVPTLAVGNQGGEEGEPDSLVEKVERMVEDTLDRREQEREEMGGGEEANRTSEKGSEGQPNPKKRMWEEEKEAAREAERVRVEL